MVDSPQSPQPEPAPAPQPAPLWTKIMLGYFWVEETPKQMVMRDFFQAPLGH